MSLDKKCIHYTDCKAFLWLHEDAIVKEAGLHTHEEEPETIAARKRVQQHKVERLLSSIAAILMHINLLRIFEVQLTVKRWALGHNANLIGTVAQWGCFRLRLDGGGFDSAGRKLFPTQ